MARLDRRLELDTRLRRILGSNNLYFEPPASVVMHYPCVRYTRERINTNFANNNVYLARQRYDLTLIYYDVDSDLVDKFLFNNEGLTFSHERHYVADGLHHDILTTTF